jgi:hypothetical protein
LTVGYGDIQRRDIGAAKLEFSLSCRSLILFPPECHGEVDHGLEFCGSIHLITRGHEKRIDNNCEAASLLFCRLFVDDTESDANFS